ncbi:tryptophanyl-tRNA synthetase [Verrucomicrobium sp. GAS474]|uniref:tryptophan--tRNA ligase n=1 Tax=Verrucomicrobium sp. GAS474 TaxID=1882831 RepID=UPI00087C12B4|nr:tryptophan--tRNA ligase [Verrucomicrobium sp. GAS474]SDT86214.1 tryptophanyl-tRNA synthetase [Verrucomicrobium sp. GAS474]
MRVFSGVQPSGALHLGNYFGMIERAIAWQAKASEPIYFVADYHALTSVSDPAALRQSVREVTLAFLACGLDPKKSIFFRQSAVPEVHELAWLLSCVTPMGLLERCHSYKDKTARGLAASHGLFAYPVLMAADILLYQANTVPVGKDQKQHIEVARDIAMKFNEQYGSKSDPVFTIPEPDIAETVAVVPGTDGQKMSKSYKNTLDLFGDAKAFSKAVMGIKTDSTAVADPKPTEGSTLVALHALVSTKEETGNYIADMQKGGRGYGDYKKELLAKLDARFAPIREKHAELARDPQIIDDVLADGARRARALAEGTLAKARRAVGIL